MSMLERTTLRSRCDVSLEFGLQAVFRFATVATGAHYAHNGCLPVLVSSVSIQSNHQLSRAHASVSVASSLTVAVQQQWQCSINKDAKTAVPPGQQQS
jgi:hypothetical protein